MLFPPFLASVSVRRCGAEFSASLLRFRAPAPLCKALSHLLVASLSPSAHSSHSSPPTPQVFCSREIKVAGAIGGCTTLPGRNPNAVAETECGLGGTTLFRVNTLTPRVAVAFFFEARCSIRVRTINPTTLVRYIFEQTPARDILRLRVLTRSKPQLRYTGGEPAQRAADAGGPAVPPIRHHLHPRLRAAPPPRLHRRALLGGLRREPERGRGLRPGGRGGAHGATHHLQG